PLERSDAAIACPSTTPLTLSEVVAADAVPSAATSVSPLKRKPPEPEVLTRTSLAEKNDVPMGNASAGVLRIHPMTAADRVVLYMGGSRFTDFAGTAINIPI